MAFLPFSISESGRGKFGMILLCLNVFEVMIGVSLLGLGGFVMTSLNAKAHLIEGYDTKLMGNMLIGVAFVLIGFHGFGAKVCYDCGCYKTRHRFQSILFLWMLAAFVMVWVTFAMSMMCFHHKSKLKKAFKVGMLTAMAEYRDDQASKEDFDYMQIEYKCCGSSNHTDWFKVLWIPDSLIPPPGKTGDTRRTNLLHSVPFSCCNPNHLGPCIHRRVKVQRPGYQYPKHTLHHKGCADALMVMLGEVLHVTGIFSLAPFFCEVAIVLLTRYLQTSIDDAMEQGDPKGHGTGMIMEECPCTCCSFLESTTIRMSGKKKKSRKKMRNEESDDESTDDDEEEDDAEESDATAGSSGFLLFGGKSAGKSKKKNRESKEEKSGGRNHDEEAESGRKKKSKGDKAKKNQSGESEEKDKKGIKGARSKKGEKSSANGKDKGKKEKNSAGESKVKKNKKVEKVKGDKKGKDKGKKSEKTSTGLGKAKSEKGKAKSEKGKAKSEKGKATKLSNEKKGKTEKSKSAYSNKSKGSKVKVSKKATPKKSKTKTSQKSSMKQKKPKGQKSKPKTKAKAKSPKPKKSKPKKSKIKKPKSKKK